LLNPEIRQTRTQLRNFPPTQVIVGPRQPPSPISKLLITMCQPNTPAGRPTLSHSGTGPGNYTLASCCPRRHGRLPQLHIYYGFNLYVLSILAINPLKVSNLSLLSPDQTYLGPCLKLVRLIRGIFF